MIRTQLITHPTWSPLLACLLVLLLSSCSTDKSTHSTYLVEKRLPNLEYVQQIDYGQFDYIYFMASSPWNNVDFDQPQDSLLKTLVYDYQYREDKGTALAPQVIRNAHDAGTKILLCFAGRRFKEIVESEERRPKFIAYISAFCEKYNYDGIDIDWENDVTSHYHTVLMHEIRASLNELETRMDKQLYLTTALNSYMHFSEEETASLVQDLDWVNIMTYDFGGGHWGKAASHNTPLDKMKKNLGKWELFPKEKLCIGLANYGYLYKNLAPDQTVEDGLKNYARSLTYLEALKLMEEGWTPVFDEKAQAPYYFSPDRKDFFTIDNPQSIQIKLDWCKEEGFEGVFWWEYTMDTIMPEESSGKIRHHLIDLVK